MDICSSKPNIVCGTLGLKDIDLKTVYDSNFTDVVEEFFVPVLTEIKKYDRMTGFFTSSSLSVVVEGLVEFIKNGGKMRIVTSPRLSEEDAKAIEESISDQYVVEEIITSCIERELTPEEIKKDGTQALGWMLANGFLEMRLVLLTDGEGHVLNSAEADGMFHNKVGILRDEENIVVFSGSINETSAGLKKNIEEFNVFCDWKPGHNDFINPRIENFEKYWELGSHDRKLTVSLPDAVKNHWIKYVPAEFDELNICKDIKTILRNYQLKAIDSWLSNGKRGIFNMATGTGKTLTATHAVKKFIESEPPNKLIIVVAVPLQHLAPQWEETIKATFDSTERELNFVSAYDSSSKWIPILEEQIHHLKIGVINTVVVLTTYVTLSSGKIQEAIEKSKAKILLIGDEVHNAGAKNYSRGLSARFDYRLGLSATPERYFDDEGSKKILDYFGSVVFEFSLERAIKEGYLVPYYYYPLFVSLDSSELEEYGKYSEKIAKLAGITADRELTVAEEKNLEHLRIQRSRIVKRAKSKIELFRMELPNWEKNGFIDHTIVYCSDGSDDDDQKFTEQIIMETNRRKIPTRRFTSCESRTERSEILKLFDREELKALIAIKCLDEGVDVPSTKTAIIMASTGNPREYVQRRGRVLRTYPGKTHADIFDFIVVPGEPSGNFINYEVNIFEKEYERFLEFSRCSLNPNDNLNEIEKQKTRFESRGGKL